MISLFKYKLFCSHLITLIGEVRNRSEKLIKNVVVSEKEYIVETIILLYLDIVPLRIYRR